MSAPVKASSLKLAREQHRSPVPQKAKPTVSSALLDLIDSCTPPSSGFVAPNATRNADDEQEVHIDPSATYFDFDQKQEEHHRRKNKRRAGEARAEKAARGPTKRKPRADEPSERPMRGVPKHAIEEVFALVRLHGPLSAWEATTRMQRCGYPKAATLRALATLQDQGKVTSTIVQLPKGHPPVLVYEVKV